MLVRPLTTATAGAVRRFSTTALRLEEGMIPPGHNLPFRIDNRFRLTAVFILFFGSAIGAPFLMLRHQLLKKQG